MARHRFVARTGQFVSVVMLSLCSARIGTQPTFLWSRGSAISSNKSLTALFIAYSVPGLQSAEQPFLKLIVPTCTHGLPRFPRVFSCLMAPCAPDLNSKEWLLVWEEGL